MYIHLIAVHRDRGIQCLLPRFFFSLLFTAKFTATFLSGFMEMMNIPAGRSHGSQDSIMCYMLSARRAYRPLAAAESLRQNQDVC
jgi:hypothetical protein